MRLISSFLVASMMLLPVEGLQSQKLVDTEQVASLLVQRMQLQPGERVLFVAVAGRSDNLIAAMRRQLAAARAVDLGVLPAFGVNDPSWLTDFTIAAPKDREGLTKHLSSVDLAIMMPGAQPQSPVYAGMQDVLRSGKGRTIHFHWEGAYALDGTILRVNDAIGAWYERVLRETDYGPLGAMQARFESAVRTAPVRVTTPAGTDITFRIGDRPVTKQDGDASAARAQIGRNLIDREVELPAGAIRVAPIEESVNGQIAFPTSVWGDERVEGLVMRFTAGRVTGFTAKTGTAGVERELAQAGDGGRAFREFALGFNPLLAIPDSGERWIPYYGYGAGVVRLSLGDNTELGGKVGGEYVRWNFFTDATVTVGNDVWVSSGKMIKKP